MSEQTKGIFSRMILFTAALAAVTLACFLLYRHCHAEWLLSAGITALTVFYHFAMRLAVGEAVTAAFRGKEFPADRLGFPLHGFEPELYRRLGVKRWKKNAMTARPEQFDLRQAAPRELLRNMMQAELVHRIIMVLSFVPLLFIVPFGEPAVFVLTSVLACGIDMKFVIIQRYNRPRAERYIALTEKRKSRRA